MATGIDETLPGPYILSYENRSSQGLSLLRPRESLTFHPAVCLSLLKVKVACGALKVVTIDPNPIVKRVHLWDSRAELLRVSFLPVNRGWVPALVMLAHGPWRRHCRLRHARASRDALHSSLGFGHRDPTIALVNPRAATWRHVR